MPLATLGEPRAASTAASGERQRRALIRHEPGYGALLGQTSGAAAAAGGRQCRTGGGGNQCTAAILA